tara:strand:- start:996 stop:1427 length:432 start_codon:yes stop_codon:yes gene_type:complete
MDGKQSTTSKTDYKPAKRPYKSYFEEKGDYLLKMQSGEIKDKILLGENDCIQFYAETDIPGQLVFHYKVLKFSLSDFKEMKAGWGLVLNYLKNLGITEIPARCKPDDIQNKKFFKLMGFKHIDNWLSKDNGVVMLEEYRYYNV